MPMRSKVMLAPADFLVADFKEMFKTASVACTKVVATL